jgi:hypothetical protein
MKSTAALFTFFSIALLSALSIAEEAKVQTAPSANTSASAPVAAQGAVHLVYMLTPRELQRLERERIRSKARVHLLYECMEREGPVFSEDKFIKYRRKKIAGIILTVLGGASVVSSPILAIAGAVESYQFQSSESYDEENDSGGMSDFGMSALIAFTSGIGVLSAGISLLISGRRGMKRQNVLREKDEILNLKVSALRLRVIADPIGRTGGLGVGIQF